VDTCIHSPAHGEPGQNESRTDVHFRPEQALEREQVGPTAQLEARTLTHGHVQTLQDFAARITKGLMLAESEISVRRALIEDLDVQVTLAVEDGQKVVYARCLLGEQRLLVVSPTTEEWAGQASVEALTG